MSHLINIQTKITEKNIAVTALKKNKWEFADQGSSLRIQSGPMKGATIDLKTGSVRGDSDYLDRSTLGGLNNGYAEALIEDQVAKQGGVIQSRTVLKNGSIEILAQVQLGH